MCPDKPTLSAFFDGELNETGKKEVWSHANSCSECQEVLQEFNSQRQMFQNDDYHPRPMGETLKDFKQYAQQAWFFRGRFHSGRGLFVIPIPLVAAVLGFLVLSMFLNLLPIIKRSETPIVVLKQRQVPSTVISITVPPSELDSFISLIEGTQGIEGDNVHVLPINLPVDKFGAPRIIPVTSVTDVEKSH